MPPHLDSNSSAHVKRLGRLFWQHCQPCSHPPPLGPLERPETPLPRSGLSGPRAWACSWEGRKGEKQALLPLPRARAAATDPTTPVISSDNGPAACRHRGQQGFQCRAAGEVDGQEDPERQGSSEKREHEKTSGPVGAAGTDGGVGGGSGAVSSHRPRSRREHTTAFYFHDSPHIPSSVPTSFRESLRQKFCVILRLKTSSSSMD